MRRGGGTLGLVSLAEDGVQDGHLEGRVSCFYLVGLPGRYPLPSGRDTSLVLDTAIRRLFEGEPVTAADVSPYRTSA